MLVEINGFEEAVGEHLRPDVGMYRAGLQAYHRLFDDLLAAEKIPHAQSGGEGFRESTRIQYMTIGVELLYGRYILPREAKRTIGIILKNIHAVFPGDIQHHAAALKGSGSAGRVLEVGDGVDEFCGGVVDERLFEQLGNNAVVVHGNADEPYAVASECVQRTDEGGILAEDHIALVAEYLSCCFDGLLRAGSDNEHISVAEQSVFAEVLFKAPAQRRVALGNGILEGVYRLLGEYVGGELCDNVRGERLGGGVARRKTDNGRVGGEL